MREWRRCPSCGYTKFGACPMCFPAAAEQELEQEAAQWRREQADGERRAAGLLYCPEHEVHDGCWRPATRAEIRGGGREMTWQQAMDELRRRYVPPA